MRESTIIADQISKRFISDLGSYCGSNCGSYQASLNDNIQLCQQTTNSKSILPEVGIGDDCALVNISNSQVVVASDTLVENVHFPIWASAYSVGYKLAAVNLSDFAACNAKAKWAVLNLCLPDVKTQHKKNTRGGGYQQKQWLDDFFSGLNHLLSKHHVALIGGDTCRSKTKSFSLTLFGETEQFISRSNARVDDLVFISGPIGNASLALNLSQHAQRDVTADAMNQCSTLRQWVLKNTSSELVNFLEKPQPRTDYVNKILECASSSIDLSDGLLVDLCRLLKLSSHRSHNQLGIELNIDSSLIDDQFRQYYKKATLPKFERLNSLPRYLQLAITGGDDYQLLFTVPPQYQKSVLEGVDKTLYQPILIGRITSQQGLVINGETILETEELHSGSPLSIPEELSSMVFEHTF